MSIYDTFLQWAAGDQTSQAPATDDWAGGSPAKDAEWGGGNNASATASATASASKSNLGNDGGEWGAQDGGEWGS